MTDKSLPEFHEIHILYKIRARSQVDWRLGQWFYNNYDHSDKPFPALFHEKDMKMVIALIKAEYYNK